MNVLRNISLLPYNTFGIDEEAECLIEYDTVAELREILRDTAYERPLLHIGDGSNLLFLKRYNGTILKSRIKSLEVIEQDEAHITVRVGAGWEMLSESVLMKRMKTSSPIQWISSRARNGRQ